VPSVLETRLRQKSYVPRQFLEYMKLSETVLEKKKTVCGTMRANRAVPHNSENKTRKLKQGQSSFWREDDIMVQVWKDKKRLVSIIRTIHKAKMIKTKRNDKKTGSKETLLCFPA
jgi:hypothetical protein